MAKVLVVDDDQVNQEILKLLLDQEKHEIFSAWNGLEAIQFLETLCVDLIITDITMPIMDGLEFLRRLRKNERYKHIPAIVLTASGRSDITKIASEYGATNFLSQPYRSWELKKVVNESLNSTSMII